ncbi:hypothetical protein [Geobacillus sp. YF-1]|uniref:hypothetical protein n=1 Tax=Geobacillus sp. YF-1 TaxID=3457480 RepID=UPI004045D313
MGSQNKVEKEHINDPDNRISLKDRTLGHNVIHLIYSLRTKWQTKNVTVGGDWKAVLTGKNEERSPTYYYPLTYSTEYKVLPEESVIKYFHPNVHHVLFSNLNYENDVGMKVYQYQGTRQPRVFQAYKVDGGKTEDFPSYEFEWIATELYQFQNSHFLVVRLSLHENRQFDVNLNDFTNGQLTVADWTRFVNRIRHNHLKYPAQNHLLVSDEQGPQRLFFEYVHEFLHTEPHLNGQFVIASRCLSEENEKFVENHQNSHLLREPVAFVHGFVAKVDSSKTQWTDKELYTLLSVDDEEGESGGTDSFIESFVRDHTYKRWSNEQTFYTAIDYAAITVLNSSHSPFYEGKGEKGDFVGDILYQHHCNHYLILVLLQLYYREELQEILGRFSRLKAFDKDDREIEKARSVIDEYYNLNQYFIFDRLTNEIQGLELWKFYQQMFGTNVLYGSVKQDMQELNQRLIEYENKNQSAELKLLTVLAGLTGLFGMNRIIAVDSEDQQLSWLAKKIADYSIIGGMFDIIATVLAVIIIAYVFMFLSFPQCIRRFSKKSVYLGRSILFVCIVLVILQIFLTV